MYMYLYNIITLVTVLSINQPGGIKCMNLLLTAWLSLASRFMCCFVEMKTNCIIYLYQGNWLFDPEII